MPGPSAQLKSLRRFPPHSIPDATAQDRAPEPYRIGDCVERSRWLLALIGQLGRDRMRGDGILAVAGAIQALAGPDGCRCTAGTLARHAVVSVSTAQRALARLEALGWLRTVAGGNGGRSVAPTRALVAPAGMVRPTRPYLATVGGRPVEPERLSSPAAKGCHSCDTLSGDKTQVSPLTPLGDPIPAGPGQDFVCVLGEGDRDAARPQADRPELDQAAQGGDDVGDVARGGSGGGPPDDWGYQLDPKRVAPPKPAPPPRNQEDPGLVALRRIERGSGHMAALGFQNCLPAIEVEGMVIYAPMASFAYAFLRGHLADEVRQAGYRVEALERRR